MIHKGAKAWSTHLHVWDCHPNAPEAPALEDERSKGRSRLRLRGRHSRAEELGKTKADLLFLLEDNPAKVPPTKQC